MLADEEERRELHDILDTPSRLVPNLNTPANTYDLKLLLPREKHASASMRTQMRNAPVTSQETGNAATTTPANDDSRSLRTI